jgi:hypothetical protein
MSYTMTTAEAAQEVYLTATRKTTTLDLTTGKGAQILALLNKYTRVWGKDDWASMRNVFTVSGTVTATDTFTLPTTMHHASQQEGDFVRITHVGGTTETDYFIVPVERLYNGGPKVGSSPTNRCAISGSSLVFDGPFTSSSAQFGGTTTIPGYAIPATLSSGTDVIQVDDPQWLTARCAADYCLTDVTRAQLYDTIKSEADQYWFAMKSNNDSQMEATYRGWNPLSYTGGAWD